jgi:hypothetical protein
VNSIEDGARAAMQAVAGSIADAPPLRLDPARLALPRTAEAREADERALRTLPPAAKRPARVRQSTGRIRRHQAWLAPLAAAAVVVAVALSLVLVRIHPNARVVPPSAPVFVPAGSVPRYFVELDPMGSGANASNGLLIADTYTGKTLASVAPPAGLTFQSVSAASDDRTFVLFATPAATNWSTDSWYELRIAPGSAHPATLTRLPVRSLPYALAMAVSGSGRELAVVSTGAEPTQPDVLSIYSLATGGLLHSWFTPHGSRVLPDLAWNVSGPLAVWPILTWVNDDRAIIFPGQPSGNLQSWTVRQLDVSAKGSSLAADSPIVWTDQTDRSQRDKYGCDLDNPLAVSPDGQTFVCPSGTSEANGERLMKWLVYPSGVNPRGRVLYQTESNMGTGSSGYNSGLSDNDVVLWTNQSGSTLIVLWYRIAANEVTTTHFGVISNGRFFPLPAALITDPTFFSPMSIAW